MVENHTHVSQGFRVLLKALAPYLAREFQTAFGHDWWNKAVLDILYEDQKRDLPTTGEWADLVDSLDIYRALLLFDLHWHEIFRKKLSIDHRTWAKELVGVRNKLAHLGVQDFSDDDTWRALDTMSRLCEAIDPDGAEEIRSMLRRLRYGSEFGSTAVTHLADGAGEKRQKNVGILDTKPLGDLPSWREVIEPHPDVAQGRYRNAEFAADLAQVSRGEGSFEYRDPVEFFARTYVTQGLAGLLTEALLRVSGKGGEPVIQLKTAFGGGKTHSMLALYHVMRARVSAEKLAGVKPILESVGLSALPRANVAVLVGTALDPSKSRRPANMPGITINTFWGEMAAQLGESAGDPSLYNYVKEADKRGVSPGSAALKSLFDAAGPCVILMDEIVAYGKKIYGVEGLPAGSFDNFVTFIQEVTEAARASKNSLVVASIPESDIEIGGEAGSIVLETIEHTFGRMESIWKPVAANEGFEVVRRRLFLDCKDPEARERVCGAFSRMYAANPGDFPVEARELEYKERLLSCYPIHPEVFDRLYQDWSTLERFQRTRGVLRLMAAVIHELWMGNDASLLIMPGTFPLNVPSVRDELTRHLPENWNSIVDREVDGRNSIPYLKDQPGTHFSRYMAARRVARTIMLGSAPTERSQAVRGIEASRIRLGVVQPGENIPIFNDALNTLRNELSYLYSNPSGDRYWYDNRPTLRKTAEDRATQVHDSDVEYEIEQRLRKLRKERPFGGVHICPASSLDVPDEQSARLVILRTKDSYKPGTEDNRALSKINDILHNRGTSPRLYRNMLAFVAPDKEMLAGLEQAVRWYLAWKSIKDDHEILNLDAAQNRETETSLERADVTVNSRIKETYCWLLVPYVDRTQDLKAIHFDTIRISGGDDTIVQKAGKKMLQNEAVVERWAPALLRMELDNLLWKEAPHIAIKSLWDYLCTYCYLPRLANVGVLEDAIRTGLNSTEYFAYAAGFDGTRYIDLKFNQPVHSIDQSGYLVKVDRAQAQLAAETAPSSGERLDPRRPAVVDRPTPIGGGAGGYPGTQGGGEDEVSDGPAPSAPQNTSFFLSTRLDDTRIGRDVQQLMQEVINHLINTDGCEVEIRLEVTARTPQGFSPQIVRVVSENSRTLKVEDFGFEG
ncbi:MAG TPA: ATP-binding protein [Firmicutes bacterium]|nr:MAG: hypothetical protein AA931_11700 [Peptococcaceae bacterium 1109]HHT74135.1 ATP-binding protein [Bacillota bacterium]